MKNAQKFFGIIAIVAVIGLSMVACDDGSNDASSGGNLINGTGEAWVAMDEGFGYVFKSNGNFDSIEEENGLWEVVESGKYSTNGNKLTLTYQETATYSYSMNGTYSVTGNILKMTISEGGYSETITLTKTKITIKVFTPPSNHNSLINGQWMNGSISSAGGEVWYSFNVVVGTTYRIWWNDSYDGDGSKSADIRVKAYDANGVLLFDRDDGWDYPRTFTPTSNGTAYLKITGYDEYNTGTFSIVYSTSNTRP